MTKKGTDMKKQISKKYNYLIVYLYVLCVVMIAKVKSL